MQFFAQIVAPAEIAAWLACLTFTTMLFNQLARAKANLLDKKSRNEISPDPLNVRTVPDVVTEHACLGRHIALDKQLHELRADRKADVNALHDRINCVARELGELAAAATLQNQRMALIEARLDRMIERHAET